MYSSKRQRRIESGIVPWRRPMQRRTDICTEELSDSQSTRVTDFKQQIDGEVAEVQPFSFWKMVLIENEVRFIVRR
jgi:hypothetical protein